MRLGLRARIAFTVILVTLSATTATAFAAYHMEAGDANDEFLASARESFTSNLAEASQAVEDYHGDPVLTAKTALTRYTIGRFGVTWSLRRAGSVVAGYELVPPPASFTAAAQTRQTEPITVLGKGDQPYLVLAGPVTDALVLVEFYPLDPLRQDLARLRWSLIVIGLVLTVLGAWAAVFAAKRIQRPVRRVATAARKLGAGEFDTRVPVRGRDEVADLASSFNAMAAQVGDSIRRQRRFVADVAHDLRNPIATMVAAADILDNSDDATARERSVALLGVQSRRIARLVEDLLEISRFDAGAADVRHEHIDLRSLVLDAVELSGAKAEVRTLGDVTLNGDPRRIHTIIRNLLSNAVQHGREPITVTVDGTGRESVTTRVADSGPGIPAELLPIVFDRFVRGDPARGADGGSGLGLAIARENALVHGGSLTAANDGAPVFTLSVPRGQT